MLKVITMVELSKTQRKGEKENTHTHTYRQTATGAAQFSWLDETHPKEKKEDRFSLFFYNCNIEKKKNYKNKKKKKKGKKEFKSHRSRLEPV